jgi:hypothetical protein
VQAIGIANGDLPREGCRLLDLNGDGAVSINEVLSAVANALNGC